MRRRDDATLSVGDRDEDPSEFVICPLVAKEQLQGLIAVSSAADLPVELTNPIETLAAQAELALDRERLTETFHARRSEARFQTLVQNASDVILIARPDTTITYQTPSATTDPRLRARLRSKVSGSRHCFTPRTSNRRWLSTPAWHFGTGNLSRPNGASATRDGSWRHVEVVLNNLLGDSTVEGIVLTMRDVSERKGLEEELKHQAFHDALERARQPRPVPGPAGARTGTGGTIASPYWRFCSSTSTTSSSSTTASGTLRATSCWWPSRVASPSRCGRATPRPASAATSLPSCSRRSRALTKPVRWQSASSPN